eukprot:m.121183 g.121183  ORF g.121183 m.121183 type:complete len:260 (-) comp11076_c0_seq1:839-1618(-)
MSAPFQAPCAFVPSTAPPAADPDRFDGLTVAASLQLAQLGGIAPATVLSPVSAQQPQLVAEFLAPVLAQPQHAMTNQALYSGPPGHQTAASVAGALATPSTMPPLAVRVAHRSLAVQAPNEMRLSLTHLLQAIPMAALPAFTDLALYLDPNQPVHPTALLLVFFAVTQWLLAANTHFEVPRLWNLPPPIPDAPNQTFSDVFTAIARHARPTLFGVQPLLPPGAVGGAAVRHPAAAPVTVADSAILRLSALATCAKASPR